MKIQSAEKINYIPNTKTFTSKGKNPVTEPHLTNRIFNKSVPINSYIAYLPNFTSRKRTHVSEMGNLQEKTSDFKLTQFDCIPCPACGKTMMSQQAFDEFLLDLEFSDEDEYLNILKKYKNYMRPVEESVFNEIYALSKKDGAPKDIRTLLVSLRKQKLPALQETQMQLTNKMMKLSKELPDNEKYPLQKKIKNLKSHIKKTNSEAPFRRKILLDRISKVNIKDPVKYERLQQIARSFPTSHDLNSAWIVKYSGLDKKGEEWTSKEIATRLLQSSISNTDHIIPYSVKKNRNDIANYMAMHRGCNSQKSDKHFMHWLNEDKENRLKYLKDYFTVSNSVIQQQIDSEKYQDYATLATDTIRLISKGKVDIK